MQGSNHIGWLDGVKGLGILMIMLVHLNALPFDTKYIDTGYVAMYFVVSGLTLRLKSTVLRDIANKARRLMEPYFFYAVAIVLVSALLATVVGKNYDLMHNLVAVLYARRSWTADVTAQESALLLKGGCTPLWFLPSLFTALILTYIWLWSKRSWIVVTVYLLAAIGCCWLPWLLPWSIDVAPLGALLIIAGVLLRNLLMSERHDRLWILILLTYGILIYCNGSANMSIRIYGESGLLSVGMFFVIGVLEYWLCSVFCRFVDSTVVGSALRYLGRHSLRLMCIHMFVWVMIKDTLEARFGTEYHYALVLLALCFILIANQAIEILNTYINVIRSKR